MQKINLRELYPDIYKTDTFLEVTDEVQAVFLADKRAEDVYKRQLPRRSNHQSALSFTSIILYRSGLI